jgi:serine/threonine protein kinase
MIGKSILNYEIKSLIGEGGMGSVYLATHTQVNRTVAIKSLLPQFMSNDEIKHRFKNEASTLAHLQHPNVVGLYDYVEDETGMYLVMEYVDGIPLDDFIKKVTGPMPEERAIPIIKTILSAFSYAHQKGIVHRDIKPANIIITQNDGVKILDFGIARILGESNHNLTKTGTQMGTVYYMSPEQVQGKKVDIRSDIYSLGVTFYQMLTGVNPYNGLTTEYEVYSRIVKEDLPPPQEIYPGVPAYLATILKKALAKEPDDRFQTCEEFLKAIEAKATLSAPPVSKPSQAQANPQQAAQQVHHHKPMMNQTNGIATAGLVLGILGLILSFIPFASFGGILLCLLAIIFGAKGLSNVRKNAYLTSTKGQSTAGLVIGIIGLLISLAMSIGLVYVMEYQDSDGDGIVDTRDLCPSEYGDYSNDGCPMSDMDNDGVEDQYDNCANESGPIENSGCPWPDSDEDGVLDKDDACPETYGDGSDGCPSEGSHVFWFDADATGNWDGTVSIYVNGSYVGEITEWYNDNPGCNASGCVTVKRTPGVYRWSARSENGTEWNDGTFEIFPGECDDNGLYVY